MFIHLCQILTALFFYTQKPGIHFLCYFSIVDTLWFSQHLPYRPHVKKLLIFDKEVIFCSAQHFADAVIHNVTATLVKLQLLKSLKVEHKTSRIVNFCRKK